MFIKKWVLGAAVLMVLEGCDAKAKFGLVRSLLSLDTMVITIARDGAIEVDDKIDDVRWYCNISVDDPTICRGRADTRTTTLRFFEKAPVTFRNQTMMLYKTHGRIVAVELTSTTDNGRKMLERFGPLIENRYATSKDARGRACGDSDAAHAIESAEPNVNERHSSICADIGSTEITWRFCTSSDRPVKRTLQLTIQAPGLPGPGTWWLG